MGQSETKDYKITFAEARDKYPTDYGDMQSYALKLEGIDGYVQLGQKPETEAPRVGGTLHGYTYEQSSRKGPFLKFKKVNPEYQHASASKPQADVDAGYHTQLLEAIAKAVGAGAAVRGDVVLEDIDDDKEIDLSEIPF